MEEGWRGDATHVVKLIPIPRSLPINNRRPKPFIPKITLLPRKIIFHFLLERQVEELFADIEKRSSICEEGVPWVSGAEVEVEETEVFAGGEEAGGFVGVVGEEFLEGDAEEGGGGDGGGEGGERGLVEGGKRVGDGRDGHG